jgi:hypothetical protein
MMKKGDTGTIVLLLCVLAFAVVIVEEWWLRTLIAFVPALLLAQRAIIGAQQEGEKVGAAERRADVDVRGSIDELLKHIREFYSTCHLMGTGRMDPTEALEKAGMQEKDLNRLLAEVTDMARGNND